GWNLTGDAYRMDVDGYFWYQARTDDMIISAGYNIAGPEVESALLLHPAVAECAVIGVADEERGHIVKAFVVLRPGHVATDELRLELIGFGRKRLGAAIAPREIAFVDDLPKTRSGKIMRRLLRARELGLPEGDLSTLEVTR
ncbi:MAG: AMP-binding enzyme, partial [Acidimicrobiia bacterium]